VRYTEYGHAYAYPRGNKLLPPRRPCPSCGGQGPHRLPGGRDDGLYGEEYVCRCTCTLSFTCGVCLTASAERAKVERAFGVVLPNLRPRRKLVAA
jgi:hypothetical protein